VETSLLLHKPLLFSWPAALGSNPEMKSLRKSPTQAPSSSRRAQDSDEKAHPNSEAACFLRSPGSLSRRESARLSLIITARQPRLVQDLTSSPKSEVYTPTATRSLDKEAKPKVTSLRVFPSGLLDGADSAIIKFLVFFCLEGMRKSELFTVPSMRSALSNDGDSK
jgi:hypothetical protein